MTKDHPKFEPTYTPVEGGVQEQDLAGAFPDAERLLAMNPRTVPSVIRATGHPEFPDVAIVQLTFMVDCRGSTVPLDEALRGWAQAITNLMIEQIALKIDRKNHPDMPRAVGNA